MSGPSHGELIVWVVSAALEWADAMDDKDDDGGSRLDLAMAGLTSASESLRQHRRGAPNAPGGDSIVHAFPLRPGLTIRLQLPADLTQADVVRIHRWLLGLPFEQAPIEQASEISDGFRRARKTLEDLEARIEPLRLEAESMLDGRPNRRADLRVDARVSLVAPAAETERTCGICGKPVRSGVMVRGERWCPACVAGAEVVAAAKVSTPTDADVRRLPFDADDRARQEAPKPSVANTGGGSRATAKEPPPVAVKPLFGPTCSSCHKTFRRTAKAPAAKRCETCRGVTTGPVPTSKPVAGALSTGGVANAIASGFVPDQRRTTCVSCLAARPLDPAGHCSICAVPTKPVRRACKTCRELFVVSSDDVGASECAGCEAKRDAERPPHVADLDDTPLGADTMRRPS